VKLYAKRVLFCSYYSGFAKFIEHFKENIYKIIIDEGGVIVIIDKAKKHFIQKGEDT